MCTFLDGFPEGNGLIVPRLVQFIEMRLSKSPISSFSAVEGSSGCSGLLFLWTPLLTIFVQKLSIQNKTK